MKPRAFQLDLPDGDLIGRFLDGDEIAFCALFERHSPQLKATLLRLLGARRQDADDLVQDTWLSACRGLAGFRGDARFSTWLASIGIRIAIRHLGRFGTREVQIGTDIVAHTGAPDPAIDLERSLAALPDQHRIVVVLHDVEGFTHSEIAEQLGIAEGTSRATLFRARQSLRIALCAGEAHAR